MKSSKAIKGVILTQAINFSVNINDDLSCSVFPEPEWATFKEANKDNDIDIVCETSDGEEHLICPSCFEFLMDKYICDDNSLAAHSCSNCGHFIFNGSCDL